MAAVTKVPGLGEQVALVMRLRWMLFRNGLKSVTAKLSLAGSIIVGIIWTAMSIGTAVGIGVGSYLVIMNGQFGLFEIFFWGVFAFWQLLPILSTQFATSFDSSGLLRFPLRFSSFFVLNIAYGLADPLALTAIAWHLALWIGATIARPDLAAGVALVAILSIAMNLAFGRMVFVWLERFLAQRKTRELMFVFFMLGIFALQFSGIIVQRYRGPLATFYERTAAVWNALPPGELASSLILFAKGSASRAALQCGAVVGFTVAFAGLFAYRLRRQYRGESFSETSAAEPRADRPRASNAKSATAVIPAGGSNIAAAQERAGFFNGAAAAIFTKEVRYLYRNSILLMNIFIPVVLVALISVSSSQNVHRGRASHGFHLPPELIYSAGVAYAFMIMLPQVCMNSFAYDGSGVQLLYMAPVKFREVMLGKNLFQGAMLLLEALLVLGLITTISGPPPLVTILTTWTGAAVLALVHMSAGNWFSLKFPRRFEFGVRRQQLSGISVLSYFLLYLGTVAILGVIAAVVRWLSGPWAVVAVYLGLTIAAVSVYRAMLSATSRQAITQREALIGQLVRQS